MKEILFRAYIKPLKRIVPVERINFDRKTVEVDLTSGQGDTAEYDFDEIELMEYTGLTDKNGIKIFEGDVLEVFDDSHPEKNERCIVRFGEYKHTDAQSEYPNGDMGFYLEWVGSGGKWLRNDILYWIKNEFVKIISNIYKNKALLEGN